MGKNDDLILRGKALEDLGDIKEMLVAAGDPFLASVMNRAMACIENQPAVDAVKVAHGRWVFGTANHREYMKCSVCLKSQTPTGVFVYCPNCGAKMDGGAGNG